MGLVNQVDARQIRDADGLVMGIVGNNHINIASDATTTIFAGKGVLVRVVIWTEVAGGTFTIQNTAGTTLFPSAKTDYAGSFEVNRFFDEGCKIVTSSIAGAQLSVIYFA